MKQWQTFLLQTGATVAQVFNAYGSLIPDKYKITVAAVIGTFQIVVANFAHEYNPDGTPASTPYVSDKK